MNPALSILSKSLNSIFSLKLVSRNWKAVSMMKLLKTNQGVVLNVYVRPESRDFKIEVGDDEFVVHCKESPVKCKVNRELMKELSRVFKRKVEITSGFTSRQKKVLIMDISSNEVSSIISELDKSTRKTEHV
jgi:uncharacterized protein (TIGR00251 family)